MTRIQCVYCKENVTGNAWIDHHGVFHKECNDLSNIEDQGLNNCPKCKGKKTISEKYNGYPLGLPDSGFVCAWEYRDIECDLCKGKGGVKEEYALEPVKYEYVKKQCPRSTRTIQA